MVRSPAANNWIRQGSAIHHSYTVAFVPFKLKDGYERFFNDINKKNYRIFSHKYRLNTLANGFHPAIFDALQDERQKFVDKYPHTQTLFEGLYYIICSRNDNRPFPKDFDENKFMKKTMEVMSMQPEYPNMYATAIRFNIGNGVVTSLPILASLVNIYLRPIPINFDP